MMTDDTEERIQLSSLIDVSVPFTSRSRYSAISSASFIAKWRVLPYSS